MTKKCLLKCNPPGNRIFRFPSNGEQRKKWLSALGMPITVSQVSDAKKYALCSKHFTEKDFSRCYESASQIAGYRKRLDLDRNAIPTLCLNYDTRTRDSGGVSNPKKGKVRKGVMSSGVVCHREWRTPYF